MSTKYDLDVVVAAIHQHRGLITRAADDIGCSPDTIYQYIKKYPRVKRAVEIARERLGDTAEGALYALIEDSTHNDHYRAVRYYLSTQAKRRGYVERQEITGRDGADIVHVQIGGRNGDD